MKWFVVNGLNSCLTSKITIRDKIVNQDSEMSSSIVLDGALIVLTF